MHDIVRDKSRHRPHPSNRFPIPALRLGGRALGITRDEMVVGEVWRCSEGELEDERWSILTRRAVRQQHSTDSVLWNL